MPMVESVGGKIYIAKSCRSCHAELRGTVISVVLMFLMRNIVWDRSFPTCVM
jgi:cbb3-type cytochrome oxidase cytochrome c subunit